MARKHTLIAPLAFTALGLAAPANAAMIGYLDGSGGNITNNLGNIMVDSSKVDGFASLSVADFNAASTADLLSTYDALVFGWALSATVDADWGRLLPYLQGGGGIIWEDPNNLADFAGAAGLSPTTLDGSGSVNVTTSEPTLTDGIADGLFANNHISLSGASADWTPFLENSRIAGVFGEFGSGRMVVSGPDNFYHGFKGGSSIGSNQYDLALNSTEWVLGGSATTVAIPPTVHLFGLGALALLGFGAARRFAGDPEEIG